MSVRARLGIDAALAVAFLLAYKPSVTGLGLHEWLSVGLAAIGVFHTALNWDWVVHTARRIRDRLLKVSTLNLVVDVLLFAATVLVVLSGLSISQVIGPLVGLAPSTAPLWYAVHVSSAGLAVALFALHGVLHWKWIAQTVAKLARDTKGPEHEAYAAAARRRPARDRRYRPRHVVRGDARYRTLAERRSNDV
jgi:hypothetical protein